MEKSLLLFKPDSFRLLDVFEEAEEMLMANHVEIVTKRDFIMCKEQILGIWHKRCNDPIIYDCMIKAYENQKVCLWLVRGRNAINICLQIKKVTREKYGVSFIKNCIHCPNDMAEYEDNIMVIRGRKKYSHSKQYYKLKEYIERSERSINIQNMNESIHFFINAEDTIYKPMCQNSAKLQIVLYRDGIHWLTEYAVLLYNHMFEMTLCDAYRNAMTVVEYGKAPVFFSQDLEQAQRLLQALRRSSLEVFLNEV